VTPPQAATVVVVEVTNEVAVTGTLDVVVKVTSAVAVALTVIVIIVVGVAAVTVDLLTPKHEHALL